MQTLNDRLGFEAGDAFLKAAVRLMETVAQPHEHTFLARLTGGDFAIFIADIAAEEAESLAQEICRGLARLHEQGFTDESNVGHVGPRLVSERSS